MDQLIKYEGGALVSNEISPELKAAFLQQITRLLKQGETVWHSYRNTPMILFEGRPGEDFVMMQSQGGNLHQIAVDAIEGNVGYRILYNHYLNPEAEVYSKEIDIFEVGEVSPKKKFECRVDPKYRFRLENPRPGRAEDLIKLTSLLNRTEVEPEMQKKVVDEIVRRLTYKRKKTGNLITGKVQKLLGKVKNRLLR